MRRPVLAFQDGLVGIDPERPDRRARRRAGTAATMNGACQLPHVGQVAEHDRRACAPPILPAMFIMPDTVPEYLPPVSIGTAQDGPMVHSRKNIAAVRQPTAT